MEKLRLFLALETPRATREAVAGVQTRLKESGADVKWDAPEKFHITLKFLGGTSADMVGQIETAVRTIARATPEIFLLYSELGCFPSKRKPHVIWMGAKEDGATLFLLHEKIDKAMVPLGFEADERRFHPHITLGRVRSQKNVKRLITTMESVTFESQPVTIREIAIVRSDTKPSGSVYTTLRSIPLYH